MEGAFELIINIAMVVLLGATVFYCWLLNRRIQVLQDSKSELASLLKHFDRSTKRAAEAMALLQKASKDAGKSVQTRIEKAQYVLDDLNYMMDRANKMADQMEAGIAIARQREKIQAPKTTELPTTQNISRPSTRPVPTTQKQTFEQTPVSSIATEEVVYSDNMIELGKQPDTMSQPISPRDQDITRETVLRSLRQAKAGGKDSQSAISSLQSLIERVAERTQHADEIESLQPAAEPSAASARPQSRGEQELMRALQMQAEM